MSLASRTTELSRTSLSLLRLDWGAFAHVLLTLALLIAIVTSVATKDDAIRPRRGLRADVLGCMHVSNAPAVEAAHLDQAASLTDIRLQGELQPHSTWLRRVALPAGQTVYRTINLGWAADSMTDTVRVIASDGFVGVTMSFAATPRAPWRGRAEAWTDVVGNEKNLGRIRVEPTTCAKSWNVPSDKHGWTKYEASSRSGRRVTE